MNPEEPNRNPSPTETNWRLWIGTSFLVLALFLPVGALALSWLGWPVAQSAFVAFLLVGGMPEIICLLAIAVLGKANFESVVSVSKRTRLAMSLAAPASQLRYYAGLAGCLLNGVPLYIYAYAPWLLPDGSNKFYILVAADLIFFFSLFLAGGEFWEKFRRIFVWEGKV